MFACDSLVKTGEESYEVSLIDLDCDLFIGRYKVTGNFQGLNASASINAHAYGCFQNDKFFNV